MNKKFTFMVAALLAAGGFSANAIGTTDLMKVTGTATPNQSFKFESGKSYYLVMDAAAGSANTLDATDVVLGVKTSDGKLATAVDQLQDVTLGDKAYLWKVVEVKSAATGGKYYYTLYNEATKTYLSFDISSNTSATFETNIEKAGKENAEDHTVYFTIGTGDAAYDGSDSKELTIVGTVTNTILTLTDGSNPAVGTTGNHYFKLYAAKTETLTGTDQAHVDAALNTHLGGKGFYLEYKLKDGEKLENTNIFAQPIKAFYFNSVSGIENGTYFATKYPADGNIYNANEFKASTFIVVNPNKNIGLDAANVGNGIGLEFTEVKGSNIVASVTAGNDYDGKIPAANAQFTVTENDPTNAKGKLSVMVAGATYVKDGKYVDGTSNVYVGIYKTDFGKLYLTTVGASENEDYKATLASSSIATAADLLKEEGPAVYTIKFTSGKDEVTTTGSEYDKYLYSKANSTPDGWEFAAEGTKYVDIKNPTAQWIISNYNSDTKAFTFRNRLTEETIALSLNKLGDGEYTVMKSDAANFKFGKLTDGNYAVDGSAYFEGSTVKLTAATVDKTAGFATIEDEKLNDVVTVKFNIPETATTSGALYINSTYNSGASNYDVKGVIDETKATKFQLVKFDGAASESEVVISDTVYVYNDYKYWNAEDEKVETVVDGDTLAYVTYAFKQVTNDGNDWYLADDAKNVEKIDAGDEIAKFVLKKNLNGTYALIPAPFANTAYDEKIIAVENDGDITDTESLYNPTVGVSRDFVIEFGEPTPSLKAESKHVAFNTTLGYVAMNENAEGIVAPVSSLKAEYSKEDLTFWLDTADSKAVTPSFLISKAGKFLYNTVDSAYYYDSESATAQVNEDFLLPNGNAKAMFQAATLKDSETITVNGKDYTVADGLNNFKFQIVQNTEDSEGEYVIRSLRDYTYLSNSNGKLGFTGSKASALVVSVETMEAPTSNESVSASEVAVVAQDGAVVVKNAAGKNVVVSTILGQVVANEVLTSDNATINVPAGIVVVAVEGESFKINVR